MEPATAQCLIVNMKKEKQKDKKSCCIWCEKDTHASIECYKLNKMTIEERKTVLKEKKGCSICLRKGHHPKACKAIVKCMICCKRHSMVLCPDQKKEKTEENKEKILFNFFVIIASKRRNPAPNGCGQRTEWRGS